MQDKDVALEKVREMNHRVRTKEEAELIGSA